MTVKPLFVVDRPASLRILSGLKGSENKFGILAHAFTSDNFKEKFKEFDIASVKIGDSGIYQGKDISYENLFLEYVKMGVTHGIIKDCYKDSKQTLISAKQAIRIYNEGKEQGLYNFELLGVAQGNTVAEYIDNYNAQKDLGFKTVAIGGLLYKIENHKRMVKVKSNVFLRNVLAGIRKLYPDDKLFPLGVFNRNRMQLFYDLDVWAADYKGWIFKYNKEESDRRGNRFGQTRKYIRSEILNYIDKFWENAAKPKPEIFDDTRKRKQNRKLLIVSCSKKKTSKPGKAINVYDGTAFKLIKKYYKSHNHLDVKIISAKYALIDKRDKIEPYDCMMTGEASEIYRQILGDDLRRIVEPYSDIMVFGGKHYKNVLPVDLKVEKTKGKIGEQLRQLKIWLYS